MPEFNMENLTEEQNKTIQAEIDRRVSEAIKTNTKKVTTDVTAKLNAEFEERMTAAIQDAQAKAATTDQEKIALLEAELENQKAAFTKSQMERKTEQYLREAGLSVESIAAITPLIVAGADEKTLEHSLELFVSNQQKAIDAALSKQKEEFAANVVPPFVSGGQHKQLSQNEQFNAILQQENVDPTYASAQAIQFLFENQQPAQ